jgi:hypothetical protein
VGQVVSGDLPLYAAKFRAEHGQVVRGEFLQAFAKLECP